MGEGGGGGGGGQYHVPTKNGMLPGLSISTHIFSSELASHYVQYSILWAVHTTGHLLRVYYGLFEINDIQQY